MRPFRNDNTLIQSRSATTASFMSRVYFWMMAGVLMSGVTAFVVATNPKLMSVVLHSQGLFIGLIIAQLVAVVAISAAVQRMSVVMASAVYALYTTLVGITFSTIFIAYSLPSIALAFCATSFAFGGLSAYGFITKRDLGPLGSFCLIGLFGIIGVFLVSFFVPSMMTNAMQLTMSSLAVLVFAGLTAYDTQRIKAMQYQFTSEEAARKGAIMGALVLYLDFINLFINLLRLFGDRR